MVKWKENDAWFTTCFNKKLHLYCGSNEAILCANCIKYCIQHIFWLILFLRGVQGDLLCSFPHTNSILHVGQTDLFVFGWEVKTSSFTCLLCHLLSLRLIANRTFYDFLSILALFLLHFQQGQIYTAQDNRCPVNRFSLLSRGSWVTIFVSSLINSLKWLEEYSSKKNYTYS